MISRKWWDRNSMGTRQKNKRANRKGESSDSPEIVDRWEISDIPSLPSGQWTVQSDHWSSVDDGRHWHLPVDYTCSCCQWDNEHRFCGRMPLMTHSLPPVRWQTNTCHRSVWINLSTVKGGRDPFNTLDLYSGTPFLSLSGICLHSLLFKSKVKNSSLFLWSAVLPIHHQ